MKKGTGYTTYEGVLSDRGTPRTKRVYRVVLADRRCAACTVCCAVRAFWQKSEVHLSSCDCCEIEKNRGSSSWRASSDAVYGDTSIARTVCMGCVGGVGCLLEFYWVCVGSVEGAVWCAWMCAG